MKILLSGVETNNKGAELMLYAILQELERSHPGAEVFVTHDMVPEGVDCVRTGVRVHYTEKPWMVRLCAKAKITGVLNRLGLRSGYLNNYCPVDGLDYFIDGSGLLFSDQRIDSPEIANTWHHRLRYLKKKGVRIVFLPQAFGPLKNKWTQETVKALGRFADLIYARESVSYDNLLSVLDDVKNLRKSTDFTSLVDGVVSEDYSYLAGKVCVIPNIQMVSKGVLTREEYFRLLHTIITSCRENGHECYLLNHEGAKDERLIDDFVAFFDEDIEVVTRLNALEVKGLISTARLVISSRFHGVASALNTQVPCLATSWNHKYEELYKDYGLESGVLPLKCRDAACHISTIIADALKDERSKEIRSKLAAAKENVRQEAMNMWTEIWNANSQ